MTNTTDELDLSDMRAEADAAHLLTRDERHALTVEHHLADMRARAEAKRLMEADSTTADLPGMATLTELMARPRPPVRWRVEGLWPKDGRVNIVAAAKSGKTTLLSNLVRALLDGDGFLGKFDTECISHDGPAVVIFDFEMTEAQITDWYKDQDIRNTDNVVIVPLKGYASAFNFMNPAVRDSLVERYAGAHTYILDPAGPVLAALGLEENSNSNVQQFLTDWDEFVRMMGGIESAVTVHAGHNAERARGASAFLGSGDAIWTMVRNGDETSSPRYLKATGRDVDVPETGLAYDQRTRRLTVTGGNRADARRLETAEKALPYVLAALETRGELTGAGLETYIKNAAQGSDDEAKPPSRNAIREGLSLAVSRGLVSDEVGPRNSRIHRLA